jgi:hypothetical protein
VIHLYLRVATITPGVDRVLSLYTAHSNGQIVAPPGEPKIFGGRIRLPATLDDVKLVSEQIMREIARTAGIAWWE